MNMIMIVLNIVEEIVMIMIVLNMVEEIVIIAIMTVFNMVREIVRIMANHDGGEANALQLDFKTQHFPSRNQIG